MPETLQDIVASVRRDMEQNGSIAMHVDHEWDRESTLGVWCVTCGMWVIPPAEGDPW